MNFRYYTKKTLGLSLYSTNLEELSLKYPNFLENNIIKIINNNYTLNSRYKIGTILIKKDIALFIDDNLQKIYIELDKLNGSYTNDLVLVQMIFNPRSKTKAKVIQVLKRNNSEILCFSKDNKLFSVKDSIELNSNNLRNYKDGDIVILKQDESVTIVGNITNAFLDETISLYLKEQSYRTNDYTTNIEDEFKISNRIDLTHLPFCTIDPVSAKDHDDAIYYDKHEHILYVAIADVSAFIKEGGPLDIEARKRAFSIYLPDKVLPMIPFSLSANLCSLMPNVKRFAFVVKMQIDNKKLEVISSEFFEATIMSKNKYSYEEIDNVLEDQNDGYDEILKLYSLTTKFRKKRLSNGFDFRTEELRLKLNNKKELSNIVVETSSPSHKLIEECMLLANCQSAKKLKKFGIFRVHDEPSAKSIEKLIEDVSQLGLKVKSKSDIHKTIQSIQSKATIAGLENEVDELIIQSQQQARYGSKSLGHFGLGFDDYSHFTSPIRRYADLVLHRILKTKQVPKDIDDICLDISDKEREIATLVWDLEDRKYARWANQNIGIVCDAIVVDMEHFYVKTTTIMPGVRVVCDNFNGEKLFSKIKIKIMTSNIISKEITAVVV